MPESNETQPAAPKPTDEAVDHTASRSRRDIGPTKIQLNFTSMIDVIFLLLIYFVITASFVQDEGVLTANLPKGTGQPTTKIPPKPKRPIKIVLASTGLHGARLSIDSIGGYATFTELSDQLIQMQYDPSRGLTGPYKPDHPVVIKPDGNVRWQHVVNAFNAAVRARYSTVAFAQAE